jgi:hypothetical protein
VSCNGIREEAKKDNKKITHNISYTVPNEWRFYQRLMINFFCEVRGEVMVFGAAPDHFRLNRVTARSRV